MDTATTIARGGQPAWEHTFDHPTLGELTFHVDRMPHNGDWLRHAVAHEALAPGVYDGVGGALAEALAGLTTIVQRPVVDEQRDEDPDDPSHVKITKVFYDPLEDERFDFPILVWATFMTWRAETLSEDTKEQVKNSSGATNGDETVESSPEPTGSPQTIPA